MFDECERRWGLKYFPTFLPDELATQAGLEGGLMNYRLLAGQVVDDVITNAIRQRIGIGNWPDDLLAMAKTILREYIDKSIKWREGEKDYDNPRQPVTEIYYCDEITAEEKARTLELLKACLQTFQESEIIPFLESHPIASWRVQSKATDEPPPWYMYDGIPVYAKYDFAIVPDGRAIMLDWKTGKAENERYALDQLTWYAVYAMHEWGIALQDIRVAPVWLSVNLPRPWEESIVAQEAVTELLEKWRARITLLRDRKQLLESRSANLFELFPLTNNSNRCRECVFRMCEGYRRSRQSQAV